MLDWIRGGSRPTGQGPYAVGTTSILENAMPLIHVQQTPGKTAEQKAELVRELTDAYVRATGSKPESVWVTVQEIGTDSWSVAGETLAARAARS
ncbi:4-oxalocrotonate tautomerase family protein [Streptomyces sp. NPDC052040]|uniref:tautomerase family protein n=1 Tax=unclassified Streptomyces TaxID=2593676 RepID=UPI0037D31188